MGTISTSCSVLFAGFPVGRYRQSAVITIPSFSTSPVVGLSLRMMSPWRTSLLSSICVKKTCHLSVPVSGSIDHANIHKQYYMILAFPVLCPEHKTEHECILRSGSSNSRNGHWVRLDTLRERPICRGQAEQGGCLIVEVATRSDSSRSTAPDCQIKSRTSTNKTCLPSSLSSRLASLATLPSAHHAAKPGFTSSSITRLLLTPKGMARILGSQLV